MAKQVSPLPESDRGRLRELVIRHGERGAADLLRLHHQTLLRCLAGAPVARSTLDLLAIRLGSAGEASP